MKSWKSEINQTSNSSKSDHDIIDLHSHKSLGDYITGADSTNNFLLAIQILQKNFILVISLLAIRLPQIFALAMTILTSSAKFCSDHCIRI